MEILHVDKIKAHCFGPHEKHHDGHDRDGANVDVHAKVAYTFEVRNTSSDPADAELKLVSLIDDNGTPNNPCDDFDVVDVRKAFVGGDNDCDGLVDVGETWTFRVTDRVHLESGTEIVNSAVASARDADGNLATSMDQASLGTDDVVINHKAHSGSQTERGAEGLRDCFELNANHHGTDTIRDFLLADGDAFVFKGTRFENASVEDGSLVLKAGANDDLTIWANADKDARLEKIAVIKDFFDDNADALAGLDIDTEDLHGNLCPDVAKAVLNAIGNDMYWA